jgi:hypothetical protein
MLQDLIVPFTVPMGTLQDFFKIYRQFGHVPSTRFYSPGLANLLSVSELIGFMLMKWFNKDWSCSVLI